MRAKIISVIINILYNFCCRRNNCCLAISSGCGCHLNTKICTSKKTETFLPNRLQTAWTICGMSMWTQTLSLSILTCFSSSTPTQMMWLWSCSKLAPKGWWGVVRWHCWHFWGRWTPASRARDWNFKARPGFPNGPWDSTSPARSPLASPYATDLMQIFGAPVMNANSPSIRTHTHTHSHPTTFIYIYFRHSWAVV